MVHDLDSLGHHLDQEVFSGSVGRERLPLRLPAGRFLRLVVHEADTSEQAHVPGLVRRERVHGPDALGARLIERDERAESAASMTARAAVSTLSRGWLPWVLDGPSCNSIVAERWLGTRSNPEKQSAVQAY